MFDFYIPILPDSYLSNSVITTVWVGVLVVSFFNLRFGWIFTGLVVPGYLTPLLLIKPISVVVILFESVLTYQIIYILSEVASKHKLWTNMFGRDRFFALLLVSVGVRLFFDGFALGWLNYYSVKYLEVNLDVQDSLHSFGLIVVALIANHLWKPKLYNGLFQLFVTIGITFLIIKYFFIAHTNFSLSNIGYLYEDIAGSILASPKSYIILLTTAFIASRMNLFYGWEFNGILVPSLLALQWYQPTKILIFFGEAYIILLIAKILLSIPFFKEKGFEGSQKFVFFFTINFFYKILLSFFVVYFFPNDKVSDYFGFGYIISTLIAIKIHDKISMPLFTRATLQTSIVSIAIATVIGYFLVYVPDSDFFSPPKEEITTKWEDVEKSDEELLVFLERNKVKLYGETKTSFSSPPTIYQLQLFKKALNLIKKDFQKNRYEIVTLLSFLNYNISLIQNRYLVLHQKKGFYGWGMYVINLDVDKGLAVEVPFPLSASNLLESSLVVFKQTNSKTLAISGVPLIINKKMIKSKANSYDTFYHTFHKNFTQNNIIQIQALTKKQEKEFFKDRDIRPTLFVKGFLPKELSLTKLQRYLPNLEIKWENGFEDTTQRKTTVNGFTELYLNPYHRELLLSSNFYLRKNLKEDASIDSIEGLLQAWILEKKIEISKKGTESYVPPTDEELIFFDNTIFTPLYHLLKKWENRELNKKELKQELLPISFALKAMGYNLTLYKDIEKNKEYIILNEIGNLSKKHRGTFIFTLGKTKNIIIEAPRPFFESYTFEYALEIYAKTNSKALILSGTHPLTNSDRSADMMLFKNRKSIFNLLSQVFYRESQEESISTLQIRGMQYFSKIQSDVAILAFNKIFTKEEYLSKEDKFMYNYLKENIPLKINDGNIYSAGYHASTPQSLYLSQSKNDSFMVLWLPSFIRSQYQQLATNYIKIEPFRALEVPIEEEYFTNLSIPIYQECIDNEIYKHILHYISTRDIIELENFKNRKNISLKLLIDKQNKQPYLLIKKENKLIGVVKINAQPPFIINHFETSLSNSLKKFYLNSSSLLKVSSVCEK